MDPDAQALAHVLQRMAPGYGELLDALRERLSRDGDVGALFVTGSAATGEADRYSDLDLLVVTRADHAQVVAGGLLAVLEELAPVVMARWTKPLSVLSTVMEDWRRVDVVVLDVAAVHGGAPGPALRIFDELGIGELPARRYVPSPERLSEQIELFLRALGLLVRDLHRGDLRLLCLAAEFLVDELVSLMFDEIEQLRHPTAKGTSRQLPPCALDELSGIPVAQPQAQSLIDAHLAIAAAYLPRARALASRRGVRWPLEMEDATRRYLKRELAVNLPDSRPAPRA
jgi:predicted nucleotidyltransferase